MSLVDRVLQECFRLLTINQLDSSQSNDLFDIDNNPNIFIEVSQLNTDNVLRKNSKIDPSGYPRLGRTGIIEGGDFWVSRATITNSRYANAGFTFTSNIAVTVGGRLPTDMNVLLDSVEMYSNVEDIWTSRTSYIVPMGYQVGTSLTSNIGLVSTGYNGSATGVGNTTSYYNSTNSWVGQMSNPLRRYGAAGFSLTTDMIIINGGYNNGTYLTDIRSFTLSSNTWSTSIASLSVARYRHGNFCSFNGGIMAGGDNGSDSLDTVNAYRSGIVSNKTSLTRKRFGTTGLSFSAFYGLLAGGSNSSGEFRQTVDGFRYESNVWTSRAELLMMRYLSCGLSLRSDMGIICGGRPSHTTERYNNGCFRAEYLTSGKALDSSSLFPLTSPDPPQKGIFITTKQLRNQKLPINKVFANGLVIKPNNREMTYGISLDDGCTWVDDIKCGTIYDINGLSPCIDVNYKLRLRFQLFNDPLSPNVVIVLSPPTESLTITNNYMSFLGFFATDFQGANK